LFGNIPALLAVNGITGLISKRQRLLKRVIVDERNRIAFENMMAPRFAGTNIVTIWGAAHLWGIERYLRDAGFQVVNTKWYTAYHLRKYSLISAWKKGVAN
jgi:pheromone shutdown protein TraB